ncbi:RTA1 like protein-domain-containing protein [Plectosphaerella cucumerina]|uniref:RTA1 like protein-domain-containing protein n=1 Tax=Plectosphaerella cucumerina TaxID=40658 RepID=A0A8K0TC93_9PEZI|nr:RTA1 like protein-domain-containing protein [Plectosphaerella cucumerina]
MADHEEEEFDFQYYRYNPSLVAAIITTIVFAALTATHLWRMLRSRAFYFTAFTVGGVLQTIGYSGRIWGHYDKEALGGFVIQSVLILVAPALYAASIYMILGRLIRALHAERLSVIPVKWLTKTFVAGDVVALLLQAGGGGIQAGGTLDLHEVGEKVIIVGLFVQIAIFSVFMTTAVTVHRRIIATPTQAAERGSVPWRKHLWVMYATSLLILIRSVFRVIEYIQGNDGYLISHEVFLYIFDAVLMAGVMAIFAYYYIGDLEKGKSDMYALGTMSRASLATDGGVQRQGDAVNVREMV